MVKTVNLINSAGSNRANMRKNIYTFVWDQAEEISINITSKILKFQNMKYDVTDTHNLIY